MVLGWVCTLPDYRVLGWLGTFFVLRAHIECIASSLAGFRVGLYVASLPVLRVAQNIFFFVARILGFVLDLHFRCRFRFAFQILVLRFRLNDDHFRFSMTTLDFVYFQIFSSQLLVSRPRIFVVVCQNLLLVFLISVSL